MNLLNLIRWKNLAMIIIAQLLIKYALLDAYGIKLSLNGLGIILLILATVCIAAAGNIINDIYDIEADTINKPNKLIIGKHISEQTAYNLFFAFSIVGVAIGFYLSNLVGRGAFFSLFVIVSALLYVYASYLKQILIVGNIIISILVALSILIVGIFEIMPLITPENRQLQLYYFKLIFDYALFAFIINLLREIAKDLEDYDGDYKAGINTLPIVIGKAKTNIVLLVLSITTILIISYYVVDSLYKNTSAVIYFLLLIIGPLIYTSTKIFNAETKKDYSHISNMLKIIMFFGILSLLLYKFILIK